jgi:hypothetical protein
MGRLAAIIEILEVVQWCKVPPGCGASSIAFPFKLLLREWGIDPQGLKIIPFPHSRNARMAMVDAPSPTLKAMAHHLDKIGPC